MRAIWIPIVKSLGIPRVQTLNSVNTKKNMKRNLCSTCCSRFWMLLSNYSAFLRGDDETSLIETLYTAPWSTNIQRAFIVPYILSFSSYIFKRGVVQFVIRGGFASEIRKRTLKAPPYICSRVKYDFMYRYSYSYTFYCLPALNSEHVWRWSFLCPRP